MTTFQTAAPAAADLTRLPGLSPEARETLAGAATPAEGLDRLLAERLEADAVRVLAHLLPPRQAVWWAVLCAWHGAGIAPAAAQDEALRHATRWVVAPTEAHCTSAEKAARAAHLDNPAGCCARAASATGPDQAARLVATAVLLAHSQRAAHDPDASYRPLLDAGRSVLAGQVPWDRSAPPANR